MKLNKLFFILLSVIVLAGFSSCSDDDDNKANSVKYSKKEIVEFKMYVGSSEGGQEVSTVGLDVNNYWDEKYFRDTDPDDEFDTDRVYTFDNNNISATVNGRFVSTPYKINDGVIYFYDNEDKEWEIFGYGTRYRFIEKTYCYKYTHSAGSGSGSGSDMIITLNSMLEDSRFETLANMTNVTDTIMWCNVDYIYE